MTSSRQQFVSVRPSMRAYAGVGNWGRNQNLVEYRSNVKLGPTANVVVIVLLIALLGVLYLTQLSKTRSISVSLTWWQSRIISRSRMLVCNHWRISRTARWRKRWRHRLRPTTLTNRV